jgi:C-terminal domain of apextrin
LDSAVTTLLAKKLIRQFARRKTPFVRSCPKDFTFSWFVIDDFKDLNRGSRTQQHGSVPEGEYYDFATVSYTCCRDDGKVEKPIRLPKTKPFVLMPSSTDRQCQSVVGMQSQYLDLFFDSEDQESDVIPLPPSSTNPIDFVVENPKGNWRAGMHVKVCHYTPD